MIILLEGISARGSAFRKVSLQLHVKKPLVALHLVTVHPAG